MDVVLIVAYGVLVLVGSIAGGALVNLFLHVPLALRVSSLEGALKGQKGGKASQEARQAKELEMAQAMTEALELHSQGKGWVEIAKEVGLKHPGIALDFAGQIMSGKLKLPGGLGGLFP